MANEPTSEQTKIDQNFKKMIVEGTKRLIAAGNTLSLIVEVESHKALCEVDPIGRRNHLANIENALDLYVRIVEGMHSVDELQFSLAGDSRPIHL